MGWVFVALDGGPMVSLDIVARILVGLPPLQEADDEAGDCGDDEKDFQSGTHEKTPFIRGWN